MRPNIGGSDRAHPLQIDPDATPSVVTNKESRQMGRTALGSTIALAAAFFACQGPEEGFESTDNQTGEVDEAAVKDSAVCPASAPGCREGLSLGKKLNNPTHFKNLKVSGTKATFTVSSHGLQLIFGVASDGYVNYQFLIQPKGSTRVVPLASLSVSTDEAIGYLPYLDELVFDGFQIDPKTRQDIWLATMEIVSHKTIVSDAHRLQGLRSCDRTATATRNVGRLLAERLVTAEAAVIAGTYVEDSAWKGLGGLCAEETTCNISLDCPEWAHDPGGTVACGAAKGAKNVCIRLATQHAVLCQEFDKKGKLVSQTKVSCTPPPKK